jgi:hypothetical protein
MKVIFGEKQEVETIYLPTGEGVFSTESGCDINYRFDKTDKSVRIEINECGWLWEKDIDEVIAFLQAAKAQLN